MKKLLCIFIVLLLVGSSFAGCSNAHKYTLNGVKLSKYTIIYSEDGLDYNKNAANYIAEQIEKRTGATLTVATDKEQPKALANEIVVGETNREISKIVDADTQGLEFAIFADDNHIAMEGDYFVIAAAAYYFVETYIQSGSFELNVAKELVTSQPIVKKPKNFIFLIGDGMGENQTKLFEMLSADEVGAYSDGENQFYGYMFPYIGTSRTNSLSGTTDSAAAGTALSTGYKTYNGYIGKDENFEDVKSITEIAAELGKATAVMSTETTTGATPAAFSAHANDRDGIMEIASTQIALSQKHKTKILGDYRGTYNKQDKKYELEIGIEKTLKQLSENKNGFFVMYEEAYIDKHCHKNNIKETFSDIVKFNQAIGCFMEFAFYNPETFVIITADHETGGLRKINGKAYSYTSDDHTSADVLIFAYGYGAEVFDGVNIENIQIPKTIAKMWGVELKGYANDEYPALNLK